MTEPELLLNYERCVARVTLNRPLKRNALSRELLTELLRGLQAAAEQPGLRAFVLEANGPAFCAGMDLAQMQETATRTDARAIFEADSRLYRDVVWRLYDLPVPTVAVVQGPALAGGLGLLLACDLVLAGRAASFALPEPRRGITAAVVAPLLVHRAGMATATWLLLSGRAISAEDAAQRGLCGCVVEESHLPRQRDLVIDSILQQAPGALATTKRWLAELGHHALEKLLDRGMAISAQARETAEAQEGLLAFLQRRAPSWQPPPLAATQVPD